MAHSSLIFMFECQTNYILQLLSEMMKRNATLIEVKKEAELEYGVALEEQMSKTVWANTKCNSWFANSNGIITALWPSNCINYWRKTRVVDFTKFEFS